MPWKIKDENNYPPDNLYVDAKEAFEVLGNDLCNNPLCRFLGDENIFRNSASLSFSYLYSIEKNMTRVSILEYMIYLKYEE